MNEFDSLLKKFARPVEEAVEKYDLDEQQTETLIADLLSGGAAELKQILLQTAPKMIKRESQATRGFEKRNYRRWKEALDLLAVIWRICSEIGEAHAHDGPGDGSATVFLALSHLHPRSLLICNEIQCLLKGGYADAALSRWRTLHEVCVTIMFISKHKEVAARNYLLSQSFERQRALRQYSEYQERAGLTPFPEDEKKKIEEEARKAKEILGYEIGRDFDWAAKVLSKKRITFLEVEKEVEMDHWRPRVRWASQHTHAGYVPPDKYLGMSEAKEAFFQVGPSNSGLVDPIQMTAISQMNATVNFIMFPEPRFERVLFAQVLNSLLEDLEDAVLQASSRTK